MPPSPIPRPRSLPSRRRVQPGRAGPGERTQDYRFEFRDCRYESSQDVKESLDDVKQSLDDVKESLDDVLVFQSRRFGSTAVVEESLHVVFRSKSVRSDL